MNDEFLQDYCCINKYLLGSYIQKFTRKLVLLNTIEVDIFDEVIRRIKENQLINSSQFTSGKKSNKVHISLPISGPIELLHYHISLTARPHASYLLFDNVLDSIYYQDNSGGDKEFPGIKSS